MASGIKKLWAMFWRPSVKWGLGPLLVVGGIGGIIFWGGFHTAMEATNTMEFCISCHEMEDNVYAEYKETVHYSNPSGVRAVCSDCHVPHDWGPKVVRKIKATRELWGKLTGVIDTPEKFEEHRAVMAQREWTRMEKNDSLECRNCHSFEAMAFHEQSADGAEQMQVAMEEGDTCISCHKGIAHKMPDLSSGYKAMFEQLQADAVAVAESAKADVLYTLTEQPIFADLEAARAGEEAGTVLAATEFNVLERDGDFIKVRLDGWQQEGAERVIYALMGHRIFSAGLKPAAIDAVAVKETMVDPNTDLTWNEVSLEGWVSRDDLLDDQQKLWDYGREIYVASCGSCHGLPDEGHFLANQWIGIVKSMERFVALDKEQQRLMQKYLQMHASDTGGEH